MYCYYNKYYGCLLLLISFMTPIVGNEIDIDISKCDRCLKNGTITFVQKLCGNEFRGLCVKRWIHHIKEENAKSLDLLNNVHVSMKIVGLIALNRATDLQRRFQTQKIPNSIIMNEVQQIIKDMYSTIWITKILLTNGHGYSDKISQSFKSTMESCGKIIQHALDITLVEKTINLYLLWRKKMEVLKSFLKDPLTYLNKIGEHLHQINQIQKEIASYCHGKYHIEYKQPKETLILKINVNHKAMQSICLKSKRKFLSKSKILIDAYRYIRNHSPEQLMNKNIDLNHLFDMSGMIDEHTFRNAIRSIQIPKKDSVETTQRQSKKNKKYH